MPPHIITKIEFNHLMRILRYFITSHPPKPNSESEAQFSFFPHSPNSLDSSFALQAPLRFYIEELHKFIVTLQYISTHFYLCLFSSIFPSVNIYSLHFSHYSVSTHTYRSRFWHGYNPYKASSVQSIVIYTWNAPVIYIDAWAVPVI